MPEAALSANLGRCPTCGQLVTLPADAAARVACPKCRHQAPASAFGRVDGPLPALAMPVDGPAQHGSDNERTHLLLDLSPDAETDEPAVDEDNDATLLNMTPVPSSARARRPPRGPQRKKPADDERTHLLLNASDLQEELDASAVHTATGAGDDERTRLLLGPLSLRSDPPSLPGRVAAVLGRLLPPLLRASVWLEEALHERRPWALGTIAVVSGLLAPTLDFVATRGAATLGFLTWSCSSVGLGVLALARLNGLRSDAGQWDPRVALLRARSAFWLSIESFEHWARSPQYLRLELLAQLATWVALAGLAWGACLAGMRWLVGLDAALSLLPLLSGSLLLSAVVLAWRSRQLEPVPALFLQDFGNALAAAAELPPLLDLAEPLPPAVSGGSTVLHECLRALGKWRPRVWPDEAAYRAALQRHFQRLLPGAKLERERWMGTSRLDGALDLVVSGMLVVGVKRGFDAATAERALGQMSRYARAWSGKPMLLVVFESERAAVLEGQNARSLKAAHDEFALLSVRMPPA
jgi:hypothetical protein